MPGGDKEGLRRVAGITVGLVDAAIWVVLEGEGSQEVLEEPSPTAQVLESLQGECPLMRTLETVWEEDDFITFDRECQNLTFEQV